jgi:hypothetical protein
MVLPHEAMESSSLCSDSNSSMSWRRVDGPFTSKRSHSVHFHPSVMVPTGGAIGSEKPKKGSARFTNPFLCAPNNGRHAHGPRLETSDMPRGW